MIHIKIPYPLRIGGLKTVFFFSDKGELIGVGGAEIISNQQAILPGYFKDPTPFTPYPY